MTIMVEADRIVLMHCKRMATLFLKHRMPNLIKHSFRLCTLIPLNGSRLLVPFCGKLAQDPSQRGVPV